MGITVTNVINVNTRQPVPQLINIVNEQLLIKYNHLNTVCSINVLVRFTTEKISLEMLVTVSSSYTLTGQYYHT